MAEPKTRENDADVMAFIESIADARRREDALTLLELMEKATRRPARMWGSSIIGFGAYTATYANGKTADWMLTGYSPRKSAISVYIMDGFKRHEPTLAELGPFKIGKSCLYLKRLEDVNLKALSALIRASVAHMRKTYKTC